MSPFHWYYSAVMDRFEVIPEGQRKSGLVGMPIVITIASAPGTGGAGTNNEKEKDSS